MYRSQGDEVKAEKLEKLSVKDPIAALETVSSKEMDEAGNSPEARKAAQEVVVELTKKQKAKEAKKKQKEAKKKEKEAAKREKELQKMEKKWEGGDS